MRWCVMATLLAVCCAAMLPRLLYWGFASGPTALNVLNALTDFVPAIFAAQRRAQTAEAGNDSGSEEFDFVVVGAGAAGSALVFRLTEDPRWRVLLLEAGGEEVPVMTIPFFLGQFHGTDANWQYLTTPQSTSCVALEGSRCDYPAGRAVGGSTTINYMFNIRGNSRDFDNWVAMGNEGWSFAEVLPFFKKVEDVRIPELRGSEWRGSGGRIKTTYSSYFSGVAQLILRAAQEAGFPLTEDYNGAQQTGAARMQTTTFRGARWSANAGYLDVARRRPNLVLRQRSYVTRLVLEASGDRARGVRYVRNGREEVAFASREVILSAGAVNSPAILLRSGIGPAQHLLELGIPPVRHLPVGLNLMDHTGVFATFTTLNQSVSPSVPEIMLNPKTHLDYFQSRAGPLTTTGTFETLSFHDLEGTPYHSPDWPPLEILYSSVNIAANERFASVFRITKETYDTLLKPIENKPTFLSCIFALRPKSRGRVYLLDKDPFTPPLIDPSGLSHPEDVEIVLAGVRDFQKILAAPSFQKVGARMVDTPVSGCDIFFFDTDDYWRCAIRQLSLTVYHQCGTCKMGPPGDPTAVVTPDLKVIGVDGLRVVDASIMPLIVSGHLQMTSYMIGEKISDAIKSEYI